jgi:hypothetical protein
MHIKATAATSAPPADAYAVLADVDDTGDGPVTSSSARSGSSRSRTPRNDRPPSTTHGPAPGGSPCTAIGGRTVPVSRWPNRVALSST